MSAYQKKTKNIRFGVFFIGGGGGIIHGLFNRFNQLDVRNVYNLFLYKFNNNCHM